MRSWSRIDGLKRNSIERIQARNERHVIPGDPQGGFDRLMNLIPFTPLFNVTGQPAISLPLTWNAVGLPLGSQLVAEFGREDLLLRVATELETACPSDNHVPPISA